MVELTNDFARPLCRALTAPGAALAPSSDIYAPLLGSWSMEIIDHAIDGTRHRCCGEWHFARVLEGRAIQDVLIAPSRGQRVMHGDCGPQSRYGSTLRYYDTERDVWQVTWFNPVTGVQCSLTGQQSGDRIVQTGQAADGAEMRWTFKDMTPTSFHWTGESSVDGGKNWRLEAEFRARRCNPADAGKAARRRREVMWVAPDGDRFEHVRLVEDNESFEADGLIVRKRRAGDLRIRYLIRGDRDWQVRVLEIESMDSGCGKLMLTGDGAGHWFGEHGEPMPHLDGCLDIDLQASPFTNTIAIRRLALAEDTGSEIRAAFVTVPGFTVVPARQRYTRLASAGAVVRYRYEGLDTGFTAELAVDEDGLLHEYPGYFRRAWPKGIDDGGQS